MDAPRFYFRVHGQAARLVRPGPLEPPARSLDHLLLRPVVTIATPGDVVAALPLSPAQRERIEAAITAGGPALETALRDEALSPEVRLEILDRARRLRKAHGEPTMGMGHEPLLKALSDADEDLRKAQQVIATGPKGGKIIGYRAGADGKKKPIYQGKAGAGGDTGTQGAEAALEQPTIPAGASQSERHTTLADWHDKQADAAKGGMDQRALLAHQSAAMAHRRAAEAHQKAEAAESGPVQDARSDAAEAASQHAADASAEARSPGSAAAAREHREAARAHTEAGNRLLADGGEAVSFQTPEIKAHFDAANAHTKAHNAHLTGNDAAAAKAASKAAKAASKKAGATDAPATPRMVVKVKRESKGGPVRMSIEQAGGSSEPPSAEGQAPAAEPAPAAQGTSPAGGGGTAAAQPTAASPAGEARPVAKVVGAVPTVVGPPPKKAAAGQPAAGATPAGNAPAPVSPGASAGAAPGGNAAATAPTPQPVAGVDVEPVAPPGEPASAQAEGHEPPPTGSARPPADEKRATHAAKVEAMKAQVEKLHDQLQQVQHMLTAEMVPAYNALKAQLRQQYRQPSREVHPLLWLAHKIGSFIGHVIHSAANPHAQEVTREQWDAAKHERAVTKTFEDAKRAYGGKARKSFAGVANVDRAGLDAASDALPDLGRQAAEQWLERLAKSVADPERQIAALAADLRARVFALDVEPLTKGGASAQPVTGTEMMTMTTPIEQLEEAAAVLGGEPLRKGSGTEPTYPGLGAPQKGPYMGPKGGKWADAQHKIPWTEHHDKALAHQDEAEKHVFTDPTTGKEMVGPGWAYHKHMAQAEKFEAMAKDPRPTPYHEDYMHGTEAEHRAAAAETAAAHRHYAEKIRAEAGGQIGRPALRKSMGAPPVLGGALGFFAGFVEASRPAEGQAGALPVASPLVFSTEAMRMLPAAAAVLPSLDPTQRR